MPVGFVSVFSFCSGVSLSALRAYERRGKDLSRAQAETVLRLANALKCEIPDILD